MRKTVLTEKIDDLEIVIAFDTQRKDPAATKNAVRKKLLELPEAKQLEQVAKDLEDKSRAMKVAIRERDDTEIENLTTEIASLGSLIETLKDVIRRKKKEYSETEAVYLDPPVGEYLLEEIQTEELQTKFDNLDPGHYLLIDGNVIEDLRGSEYWTKESGKWKRGTVEKLGQNIDEGKVRPDKLSKKDLEEIEADRVSDLSPEKKQAEKERRIEAAKNSAVLMRGRLELEDDPDALSKAKTFLAEQKAEIDASYS